MIYININLIDLHAMVILYLEVLLIGIILYIA